MIKLKPFVNFIYLVFSPIIVLVSYSLLLFTSFFLNQYWQIILWVNVATVGIFSLLVFIYLKVFQDLKIWSKVVFALTAVLILSINLVVFFTLQHR